MDTRAPRPLQPIGPAHPPLTTPLTTPPTAPLADAMGPQAPAVSRLPGLALCGLVGLSALAVEQLELILSGRAWFEALVLAILFGTLVRTLFKPGPVHTAGIQFAARTLLEAAVMLMGVGVSAQAVAAVGGPLVLGIVAIVGASIGASYLIGRALRLPVRMAVLVACGNSICGNSAIAAVAPVIDADGDEVATAIAFTAVLGIIVVLMLPLVAAWLHLDAMAGGVLAGLTVYAVPQVLAAAAPMGAGAVQIGTVVKLVRVLMLGPVLALLALLKPRLDAHAAAGDTTAPRSPSPSPSPSLLRCLPGFILVFLALAGANSLGWVPEFCQAPAHTASGLLTVVAMAGLGLEVNLRSVTAAGPRVSAVVVLSLLVLVGLSVLVIRGLGLG